MPNPRILIVDDSPTVRQQVKMALVQAGFDVVEAVDGVDGLARIKADREIRAVICDVNMPRMTGLELLEQYQADGSLRVPILMLTTEGKPALMQKAKLCGAKGWIIKPFKAEMLVAAVQQLTRAA